MANKRCDPSKVVDKTDWKNVTDITPRELVELIARLGQFKWRSVARAFANALIDDKTGTAPGFFSTRDVERTAGHRKRARCNADPLSVASALLLAADESGDWADAVVSATCFFEDAPAQSDGFKESALLNAFHMQRWQLESFLKNSAPDLWKCIDELPALASADNSSEPVESLEARPMPIAKQIPQLQQQAEQVAAELKMKWKRRPTGEEVARYMKDTNPHFKNVAATTIEKNIRSRGRW